MWCFCAAAFAVLADSLVECFSNNSLIPANGKNLYLTSQNGPLVISGTFTISGNFSIDGNFQFEPVQTATTIDPDVHMQIQYEEEYFERLQDEIGSVALGDRIRGGDVVTDNRYPFFVMQYKVNNAKGTQKFNCGGTLIAMDTVVTAAHCVYENGAWMEPSSMEIRAGELTKDENDESDTQQKRNAVGLLYENNYNGDPSYGYDIAIIKVTTPFERSDAVQTIPVCTQEQESSSLTKIMAIGSGLTGYVDDDTNQPMNSESLKELEMYFKSETFCTDGLKSANQGTPPKGSIVCVAGKTDYDSPCKGDSGSGLFMVNSVSGVPTCVFGADSMGRECTKKVPNAIYTRLSYYQELLANGMAGSQSNRSSSYAPGKPETNPVLIATLLSPYLAVPVFWMRSFQGHTPNDIPL